MDYNADSPLRPLCSQWVTKISKALEFKKKQFQDDADEAMLFFTGPYDWIYQGKADTGRAFVGGMEDEGGGGRPKVAFGMTVNKTAELVQIFGPALYHRNPVRQVNPRMPPMIDPSLLMSMAMGGQPPPPPQIDPMTGAPVPDPMQMQLQMQIEQEMMAQEQEGEVQKARATLLQHYLNYTPDALDLKTESRWAIDEALIKGMGLLVTEVYTPAGSTQKMIGSFWESVDNLVIDPDVERLRDAKWTAIRCTKPHWEVEDEYQLPRNSLRHCASSESTSRASELDVHIDGDYKRKTGQSNDLVTYWKVYSKMGLGGRLSGISETMKNMVNLDALGNYVYVVLCEGCHYPLNLPVEVQKTAPFEEVQRRLRWPTPFWADDGWPFTELVFHDVPRQPWPMSHMKPAMGELYFMNWVWSFLAGKVKIASRDFVVILKSAGEDLRSKIMHGGDYTEIQLESIHQDIDKVVKFLQHPTFNPEIYKVLEGVTANFEKRTGLSELVYGMSVNQLRSAEEANLKGDQISVRPDDMANKVEDWMSRVARKEALACRWHLTGADVAPIMGQMGAQWWDQFVVPADPSEILHQLDYNIEAGSVRKKNKGKMISDMNQAMQTMFQPLFTVAQGGAVDPVNALIEDWAKANDFDASKYLIPPPPPPAPLPGEGTPTGGEGAPA